MNTTEIIETAEVVPVIPIEQLAEINATDQGLAQLRSKATELAALGVPTTKEQYDEVHRITMVSVKVRTESDKLSKRLAAPYKDRYDQIRAEGKRIGDHAAQSEALTRPLKEQYEAEQERLKIEAEKAAAARIQARVDSIAKLGMVFNGAGYNSPDYGFSIDAIEVQALPDEEWNDVYQSALAQYEEHQTWVAFQRQQAEAEAKRQEEERQAEAAQLQKQAEQQQVEAKRQQDEAKRLADERAELNKLKLEARQQALQALGFMATQGDSMRLKLPAIGHIFNSPNADLLAMSTDNFNSLLVNTKAMLERESRQIERNGIFDSRSVALIETGLYQLDAGRNGVGSDFIGGVTYYYSFNELVDLSDYDFDLILRLAKGAQQSLILSAQKKADDQAKAAADEVKAKQKADRERTARLKGDKKALTAYLSKYSTMAFPKLDQPETTEFVQHFGLAIDRVVNEFRRKLEEL